jgi:hypothetical protein
LVKDSGSPPSLRPLHPDESLIKSKLDKCGGLSTPELIDSLYPGLEGSLKVRPDGTMVDGHHRIKILRERGVNVDLLPRDIVPKESVSDLP